MPVPTLESFDLERLGAKLARLEVESTKMRRGPLCEALDVFFFDVKVSPTGQLSTEFRSPRYLEVFGELPGDREAALKMVHPSDRELIASSSDGFFRIRLKHKTGEFHWWFVKRILTADRMVGMMFQANCVGGFGPGIDLIAPPPQG